ncbi:MAG: PKD domain-containing protein, partial [Deltaproteobacteria bacterium]|nr:PKD domain-containing protein [Deltaproteobacteria bacterium]
MIPRFLTCLALLSALGCGARTVPSDGDGGTPRLDGAIPPPPPDGGPPPELAVRCSPRTRYTSPGRSVALMARDEPEGRAVSWRWEIVAQPAGSAITPSPATAPATQVTPTTVGEHTVRVTARSASGLEASCEFVVQSILGPPAAICPEDEITGPPGRPIDVVGDGYDDENVIAFAWSIVESPPAATATVTPSDRASTVFVGNLPGSYRLRLVVTDDDGATGECIARVRLTQPPMVACPSDEIRAPTRQPVTLSAMATDDVGVAAYRWDVVERPGDSVANPSPADQPITVLVPDRRGRYVLRFTATDADGLSDSCDVIVIGTPTPPDAICPPTIETTPLTTVELVGRAEDDGSIVQWSWETASLPTGSSSSPPLPSGVPTSRFTPDIAGEYRIRLTVVDDDAMTASCETIVRAIPREGLRVEMFWNAPDRSCDRSPVPPNCDDSDVDLHLLNPEADRWFAEDDCYFGNCNLRAGLRLTWGPGGGEDDPRLDLDDVTGFGPENINIDRPYPGTYRVGVHYYSDHRSGGRPSDNPPADVVVRIYCGGSTPIAELGPVRLDASADDQNFTDFWRVADLTFDGLSCTVTDLSP